jgi:hypothetical protein
MLAPFPVEALLGFRDGGMEGIGRCSVGLLY